MTNQETWKLYANYVDAWKPISDEQRKAIVAATLAEEIQYFTPEFQGGPEAAIAEMEGFQKKFPGAHFEVEDISTHHDVALFTWVLIQTDGQPLVKGHDHIKISAEGKIVGLTTFGPSAPKP
jgi:hypothetical protein